MKLITSNAICLIAAGLFLVALALDGAEGFSLFEPKSRDELLGELNVDAQLKPAQVEVILSKVPPSTRLGRISVKDLVRVKDISIEYCYKKELDERRDTCKLSVAGENVRRFCEYRYNQLVDYCLSNLEQIMRQNIIWIGAEPRRELEILRTGLKRQAGGQEISEDVVRAFHKEDNTLSDSFQTAAVKHCQNVVEHLDTVDAIVKHAGGKIEDQIKTHSLLDAFDLYKICQVVVRAQDS